MNGCPLLAWVEWEGLALWPTAAAVALLGMLVAAWLYRRQSAVLPTPWRRLAPLLRAAAFLAIAISLLKPVIVRPTPAEELGPVVALVDRSRSMSVTDRMGDDPATRSQLVALADALGRLPAGVRSESAAGLSAVLERVNALVEEALHARAELDNAQILGRDTPATSARLEGLLQSMNGAVRQAQQRAEELGPEAVAQLRGLSRLAGSLRTDSDPQKTRDLILQAAARASAAQAAMDARLYEDNPAVRQACAELATLSRFALAERMLGDSLGGLAGRLAGSSLEAFAISEEIQPIGTNRPAPAFSNASRIGGGIRQMLDQWSARRPRAIVLISDGRQIGSPANVALPADVPLFAVDAAAPAVRDLVVSSLRVSSSVELDQPVNVHAEVRLVGIPPESVSGEVVLSLDGTDVDSAPLRAVAGRIEPVEFTVRIQYPGVHRIGVWASGQSGEACLENNRAERRIKVIAPNLRVLLASSAVGWDYRSLRSELAAAPGVQLWEELLDREWAALPLTPRQVAGHDLVILDDVDPQALSLEQWDAVRRLVAGGGGLILLAGPGHLPESWTDSTLADLLPFKEGQRATWHAWRGEQPYYQAELGPAPRAGELLNLGGDDLTNRRRWSRLPGFYRYLAMPQLKPETEVLLLEREWRMPLLVRYRLGQGTVLLLGMNETWRWRSAGGDEQARFWTQLVRAAVEEPYAVGTSRLWLDADRLQVGAGESVRVRAKLQAGANAAMLPRRLTLHILRRGQESADIVLNGVGVMPNGRYEGVVSGLEAGDYELTVGPESGLDSAQRPLLPLHVAEETEAEMADVSGDREQLRQWAQAGGGRLLTLDQVGALPQMIADAGGRHLDVTTLKLWDSFYVFFFVVGCFSAEWTIRKRYGLP